MEQHHLTEYTGGISNVAPLSAVQERAVLETRLRHKKAYEAALRDSGLERDDLSVAEREHAHTTVARALDEYRDHFLQDVRPLLDEEQYTLLSNYETTEFNRELERLQIAINSR